MSPFTCKVISAKLNWVRKIISQGFTKRAYTKTHCLAHTFWVKSAGISIPKGDLLMWQPSSGLAKLIFYKVIF